MKKHTEKTPIDNLFARKLENMSIPPSADGFERLQAKMGHTEPETRIGIWRNPATQRYIAIAACLLLVCLFGWFYYWPTDKTVTSVATNQPMLSSPQKSGQELVGKAPSTSVPADESPGVQNQPENVGTIAMTDKPATTSRAANNSKLIEREKALTISSESGNKLAKVSAKSTEAKPEQPKPAVTIPVSPQTERIAENTPPVKPVPVVERGLIVTISEPEALVAARQAVKADADEKAVVAVNDKPEKDAKGTTLWQQVKRIKQGDVFAQSHNGDAESSLIGRAYNGLKHNFDKDKSAKQ